MSLEVLVVGAPSFMKEIPQLMEEFQKMTFQDIPTDDGGSESGSPLAINITEISDSPLIQQAKSWKRWRESIDEL